MTFGLFLPTHHPPGEDPTLVLERDLKTVEIIDALGYDEAWFGEHHSGGWEYISSPELMIAHAATRTTRIKLGTGVVSLPYHHPFIVADRMVQLDHMTRGRAMLGVGPGGMLADAYMFGIDPMVLRRRMNESLDVIMRLLAGERHVSVETDWFQLHDAQLQVSPYTVPRFHVAVVSTFSPGGMIAAGRHGLGILSMGGFPGGGTVNLSDHLRNQWAAGEKAAAEHNQTIDRADWRLVLPFYIAEDRETAIREIEEGAREFLVDYIGRVLDRPPAPGEDNIRFHIENHGAIIGSPDDAIEQITALQERTGGFGMLLGMFHAWTSPEKLARNYELFARYVIPHFKGRLEAPRASERWAIENKKAIFSSQSEAIAQAIVDAGGDVPPELQSN
jgi:limonene 1,2-monooxygenase